VSSKDYVKTSLVTCFVLFSSFALGTKAEVSDFELLAPKAYTEGEQADYTKEPPADAEKGATVLLWSWSSDAPKAEVRVFREGEADGGRQFISNRNFFHTMVFFDKNYFWQVRYLDADNKPVSKFSAPTRFQVVRGSRIVEALALKEQEELRRAKEAMDAKEFKKIKTVTVKASPEEGGGVIEVFSPKPKTIKHTLLKLAEERKGDASQGRNTASSSKAKSVFQRGRVSESKKKKVLEKVLFDKASTDEMDFAY